MKGDLNPMPENSTVLTSAISLEFYLRGTLPIHTSHNLLLHKYCRNVSMQMISSICSLSSENLDIICLLCI